MGLREYKKKRDFSRTAEPAGGHARSVKPIFVIQKHDASRLHYDFRLQVGDVLVSWAVPKGPSLDPAEKRLAVHVEDHPFDYKDFEGTIPQGEYGGGTVMVWDQGTWTPEGDAETALKKGMLKFHLDGQKLRGRWMLLKLREREGSRDTRDNWLLIKERDENARPESEGSILEELSTSVVTGRSLDEIAAGAPAKKRVRKSPAKKAILSRTKTAKSVARTKKAPARSRAKRPRGKSKVKAADVPGARPGVLPTRMDAQLATLVDTPPEGDEWFHEIKWDGYRMLCRLDQGTAQFVSRNHQDWTERVRPLADAVVHLPVETALLDGEVVVMDAKGVTSFQALQNAFSGTPAALVYCVFDLLHLDGYDLRPCTLEARKTALEALLKDLPSEARAIRYSDHIVGNGGEFLKQACKSGLEGTISKRRDHPYMPGRGADWLKNKCRFEQEFVIGGYTLPTGSRHGFGSLLLGYYDAKGNFTYAGRVGTGLNQKMLRDLTSRLKSLEQKTCPFTPCPRQETGPGVFWVRPELVAQIQYANWTDDKRLRQAAFEGLREDKPAREVGLEKKIKR